ncbi:MAG: laccase domain-containing protein, partial [Pseudomonadota bacterium]
PHIGACCYEVDEPVRSRIDDESVFEPVREGHYMLDLFALNHAQLVAAGVPAENIERVGSCTCCTPGRYLSYRRDGSGGRLLHYVRKSVS